MHQYAQLIRKIQKEGYDKEDRTGTGTRSIFGHQMRFDLRRGFPLVTGKYQPFKTIAREFLWYLTGSTSVKPLQEQGVTIWDEWADKDGELGPVYGKQWRSWGCWRGSDTCYGDPCGPWEDYKIDQISKVIDLLKNNPDSRRILVSAWNVADVPEMALPPCHVMFQFYTHPLLSMQRARAARTRNINVSYGSGLDTDAYLTNMGVPVRGLSCKMTQRSVDVFLGLPFNIACYALLTHMMAQVVGMEPFELILDLGDTHLYNNHEVQVKEYLKHTTYEPPILVLNPEIKDIDKFTIDDIRLEGYKSGPHIAAPVAV